MNTEIKHYKVINLPLVGEPNTIYYVLDTTTVVGQYKVKAYITDVNGIPIPLIDLTGIVSGVQTVQSSDNTITVTGTDDINLTLSTTLYNLINSALQSGDPISSLINDAGYITIADVPVFDPTNYDLEDFNNLSLNPFIRTTDLGAVATSNDYNDLDNLPTVVAPNLDDVLTTGNVSTHGMAIKFLTLNSMTGGTGQLNPDLISVSNNPVYQFQNKPTGNYQLATLDDITAPSVYTNGSGLSLTGNVFSISNLGVINAMINDVAWSKITGTPTTIGGYGITDFNSLGDARWSLLGHTHTFASLTSKPTTLVGYGITDAYPLVGNPSGFLTSFSESDPIYTASSWFSTTNNSTNWNTAYTNIISSLTTTGSSGASTLISNILNIPTYTLSGLGGQPLDADLTAIAALATDSFGRDLLTKTTAAAVRTYIGAGTGNGTVTSVSGTASRITSSGGNTPVIDISAVYVGQSSITTLGTITTGVWNGTSITDTYISSASTWNAKESALTFSTGLTRTTNTITANLSTGISGGQSVIGGTASGNSLTLSSTSNATKGKLLFGTSAYDEVNNRLGIGLTSPLYPLDVVGTATSARSIAAKFVAGTSGAASGVYIGAWDANNGGIWSSAVTPGIANYAFIAGATATEFNAVTTMYFDIGASPKITMTSSLITIDSPITLNGNLKLNTVGNGLYVKEGTNATSGIATLVAGTVVVSTTKVTANSRIYLTRQTIAGTIGTSVDVTARTAGTSFTITSNGSVLDTSTVAWIIIEPA